MNTANNIPELSYFRVGFKWPTKFTLLSLFFLYFLQYPLSRYFIDAPESVYNLGDWIIAYAFVIYSSLIVIFFLRLGISGPNILIPPVPQFFKFKSQRMPLLVVGFIVFVFIMWSYLMRNLKVGMTIYADFDPLPFRIVGILFYGRLIVQPLVLLYIANGYAECRWKKIIVFIFFVGLGAWAALTSGSRFTGIMFALPHMLLFKGKFRYAIVGLAASAFIVIATLARHYYLPFYINFEYISKYATLEYQEQIMASISTLPLSYLIGRTMGIAEVLLTFNFGSITNSFTDSLFALLSFFGLVSLQFDAASIKNIYGFNDDVFGGFGLGLFPNYWVLLGGNLITYTIGMMFSAYMLGKCYRYYSIGLARFGFADGANILFIIFFVFFFEARSYIFLPLLVFGWFFSRKSMPNLLNSLLPRLRRKSNMYVSPSTLVTNRK